MIGFFERQRDELLAAGRRHHARRLRGPRRTALAVAAALLLPAGAYAGARELDLGFAPGPSPPDPAVKKPKGFNRAGPVSRVVYIDEGRAIAGRRWRISAYSCGDRRPDHIALSLSTSPKDPARDCYFVKRGGRVRELSPRLTYFADVQVNVSYGTTSLRVDTVVLTVGDRRMKVRTRTPPQTGGLPGGWRSWVVELPGKKAQSPKRIAAYADGREVACLENTGDCDD